MASCSVRERSHFEVVICPSPSQPALLKADTVLFQRATGRILFLPLELPLLQRFGQVKEATGAGGRERGASVHRSEEEEAGGDGETLGDPAKRKTHAELQDCGEDGKSRLGPAHEVFGDDGHQRGLRDNAGEGTEESEAGL